MRYINVHGRLIEDKTTSFTLAIKRTAMLTMAMLSLVLMVAGGAISVEAKSNSSKNAATQKSSAAKSTTQNTTTQKPAAKKSTTQKAAPQTSAVPKAKDVPEQSMHSYVQSVIAQVTTPEMNNDQKLAACYNYVLAHMKYKRDTAVGSADKIEDYALEAFFTGTGNCYRYAAMFAYMAKELGYNAVVHAGECTSNKGGMTPHSWVQIYYPDGRVLIYDGSFGDSAQGKKNYFGITAAEHSRVLVTKEIWQPTY